MPIKNHTILTLLLITGNALAYNMNHGPFEDGADVDYLPLTELPPEQVLTNAEGKTIGVTFKPVDNKVTLHVAHSGKAFLADVTEGGKLILPPTKFSNFDFVYRYVLEACTADFNLDGKADFAIYAYSGGCGLASGYCDIAFILSAGEKYTLTSISTLWPDKSNFIMLNKRPYFIHTTFDGVEECNDGKEHNFWIYNLLEFDKDKIKLANQAHPDFPKTIFFTFKPNHSETTIITEQQKAQILQRSLESIFWKEQE